MHRRLLQLFGATAAIAFVLMITLGSDGKTDGATSTGQDIANIAMPVFVLALIATGVVAVLGRRAGRSG